MKHDITCWSASCDGIGCGCWCHEEAESASEYTESAGQRGKMGGSKTARPERQLRTGLAAHFTMTEGRA